MSDGNPPITIIGSFDTLLPKPVVWDSRMKKNYGNGDVLNLRRLSNFLVLLPTLTFQRRIQSILLKSSKNLSVFDVTVLKINAAKFFSFKVALS